MIPEVPSQILATGQIKQREQPACLDEAPSLINERTGPNETLLSKALSQSKIVLAFAE